MDDRSRDAARDICSTSYGGGGGSESSGGSRAGRVIRSSSSGGSSGGGGGGGAAGGDVNAGIMDERVLVLVFRSLNFDPRAVGVAACVSRRLRAVAERVLWRELCISRAPRMVAALTDGLSPAGRVGGGWHALAKLLFFCCGCAPSRFFALAAPLPGHFAPESRFSKTSGRSFLARRCWGDLLYVSDPCEHPAGGGGGGAGAAAGEDLGSFRGVFRGFVRSRTRAWLVGRQAELEARVRCPYCGARVWSMTAAGLVPRSAPRRLGSRDGGGGLEYFVCVNGHLHGCCWLAHLSDDDDNNDDDDGDDIGDIDESGVAW
ncbi:EID1-like F-box protein 3 [Ananas comosus]|uniref:EID1-like F-box protein 3 n=1 Tax=Ananas comosus TaxID=4615 RepID=A0A199VAH7_ANACO|nr:EID1-like F-box protein 3 [Ananas comosus]